MRGTWQTTGGVSNAAAGLAGVVVAAVAVGAVVQAVVRIIWWLTGAFAVVVICGTVLAIVVRRSYARSAAAWAEVLAAKDARRAAALPRAAAALPPVEQHVHFHGVSAADVAAILEARRHEGQH